MSAYAWKNLVGYGENRRAVVREAIRELRLMVSLCDCGKKLAKGTRGVECRSCWEARERAEREARAPRCACGKELNWGTRGDMCRSCWMLKTWGKRNRREG